MPSQRCLKWYARKNSTRLLRSHVTDGGEGGTKPCHGWAVDVLAGGKRAHARELLHNTKLMIELKGGEQINQHGKMVPEMM